MEPARKKTLNKRFEGLTCYQLNLRAFTAEGTLKAAEKKLDYLKNAGIGIIYLCPITLEDDCADKNGWSERQKASGFENPKNPYRVKDYFNVDPEYGNTDSFVSFARAAHERNMFVILDLVYTHCGPSHKLVSDYDNFVKKDENGTVTVNSYHFPVLDYDNPGLRSYVISNMKFWFSAGADGFRLDYADGVPGDFWTQAASELKSDFENALIIFEGSNPPDVFADFRYGFSEQYFLYAILNGDLPASKFGEAVYSKFSLKKSTPFLRYIDNHDIITDGMPIKCDDDEKNCPHVKINSHFSDEQIMAAHAIIETLDGLPMIYTGYECGSRSPQSLFANRYHGNLHVDETDSDTPRGKAHYEWLKTLCDLRKTVPALASGKTENVGICGESERIAKYDRTLSGDHETRLSNDGQTRIRVFVNVSDKDDFLSCDGFDILLTRATEKRNSGFLFKPYGVLIAAVK